MKFWLTILVFTSLALSFAMNNKTVIHERLAGNITKLRQDRNQAFAQTQESHSQVSFGGQGFSNTVLTLMRAPEHRCDRAQQLLRAASSTYQQGTLKAQEQRLIEQNLRRQLSDLCLDAQ